LVSAHLLTEGFQVRVLAEEPLPCVSAAPTQRAHEMAKHQGSEGAQPIQCPLNSRRRL